MYTRALYIQHYARRFTALFAVIIVVSAFLYGAFLLIAVERTATRASAEAQIQSLSSDLGLLQSHYLDLTQALTPERAAALGFVTPSVAQIAYVDTTNIQALSLNVITR